MRTGEGERLAMEALMAMTDGSGILLVVYVIFGKKNSRLILKLGIGGKKFMQNTGCERP